MIRSSLVAGVVSGLGAMAASRKATAVRRGENDDIVEEIPRTQAKSNIENNLLVITDWLCYISCNILVITY